MRRPIKSEALRLIIERGIPVRTILDVGVLTGTPELIRAFPQCHHVLFEPVVEFSQKIRQSYASIDYELHNVAVSDAPGEVSLRIISKIEGMEISHASMTDAPAASGSRTVPMVSIDSFMSQATLEGPFLLKVDIDGHELKVIKGARETLKNCNIVIVEATTSSLVARIQAVTAAGFTIFDLVETCYYDGSFAQCDVIFLKNEIQQEYFSQMDRDFDMKKYQMFTG